MTAPRTLRTGTPGRPGDGGTGGRGGSSYSWTDYETENYTDSEGNQQSRSNPVSKSNSGGSSGYSGNSGSRASRTLYHGDAGQAGEVIFRVMNGDQVIESANERFKVEVLGFDITTDHPDGFLEPGEKVYIKNLRVKNTGKLSTPKFERTLLYVTSGDWVVSEGIEVEISKSLAPGEESVIAAPIPFKIKNTQIAATDRRMVRTESITPKAFLEETLLEYPEANLARELTISYPIEITAAQSVSSLKPGESSRIFWKIKNLSTSDLGVNENLKRQIVTALKKISGDLNESKIHLVLDEQTVNNVNFSKEILSLKAGAEITIGGTLSVDKSAELYTGSVLESALRFANIETGELNVIQKNPFEIRVSESYRREKNANFLLITNSRTERAELDLWKKTLKEMGLVTSHWDLSYNGHLDFTRNVDDLGTLLEGMRGKTVILLNNDFKAGGQETQGTEFLTKKNFLEAAANYGINFLVVGGKESENLL
ncbi:MAG: hypothetical protein EOP09_10740, partial [Proteobacteria bacterium]